MSAASYTPDRGHAVWINLKQSDPIPPGTYTIQAVYEYNGFRAVSDPVQVTV